MIWYQQNGTWKLDKNCSVVMRNLFLKRYLWWGDNGKCVHDSVGVLLTDLADEQGTHARAGTTTQWVCKLESLKAITALSFLTNHIENRVYKFSSLCVVTFGPVVTSTALTKHKVVWTEDLTKRSRADRVHGTWLQIHQHGTGHVFATWNNKKLWISSYCYYQYCYSFTKIFEWLK